MVVKSPFKLTAAQLRKAVFVFSFPNDNQKQKNNTACQSKQNQIRKTKKEEEEKSRARQKERQRKSREEKSRKKEEEANVKRGVVGKAAAKAGWSELDKAVDREKLRRKLRGEKPWKIEEEHWLAELDERQGGNIDLEWDSEAGDEAEEDAGDGV
jgi:flagellar biosynthesis GTPase FlhF